MVGRYRDGRSLTRARSGARRRLRRPVRALSELLDRTELTLALDEIWQRVRRLNRYVEERAPWQLARIRIRADDLDRVLATLVEGAAHR